MALTDTVYILSSVKAAFSVCSIVVIGVVGMTFCRRKKTVGGQYVEKEVTRLVVVHSVCLLAGLLNKWMVLADPG